jgi:hypothetical protein
MADYPDAPAGYGKGYVKRDYNAHPLCSIAGTVALDLPLIPREEWPDRIADMERTKSRLSDLVLQAGIKSKDQRSTNYCWINGVVTAIETIRCVMGQPYVPLSSASAGCIIKNFRNVGGWGQEGLEHVVKLGVCSEELWPNAAIDRKYYTEEAKAEALLNRCTEWYDLPPGTLDATMTCLFHRIPVAVGYNHWGHEVCAMDPVMQGGEFGVRHRTSWSDSWGENGFGILMGRKAIPDDACAPRVMIAS